MKNRGKIISDFEAGRRSETKRKGKHNFDAVDEPLLKWFRYARGEKIPVSGDMLLLKAQEYARVCGCENIKKLDMNWINWWKARKKIVCKKLPLVIGKSANPRCFKNIKKLPLPYESNKKAWMTGTIFEVWVKNLDSRMKKSNKTVASVLDNCTAHPNVNGQTNVKLIFLPPNATAKTQPLDPAVIRNLKSHYQKNLAKKRLLGFDEKKNFKIDILEGMRLLSTA